MLRRLLFIGLAALVLAQPALGCKGGNSLKGDLDYLVRILSSVHVSTAEGLSADQQAALAEVYGRLEHSPPSSSEFVFLVNRVLALMGDAHTTVHVGRPLRSLDLPLVWLADGLHIVAERQGLLPGDRIVAIGGMEEPELLAVLTRYVPAENPYWVKVQGAKLLVHGEFLEHLGVVRDGSSVEVVLERNGERLTLQRPLGPGEVHPPLGRPWVSWSIDKDHSLGIFRLDRCELGAEYDQQLRAFFRAVADAGVEHIVVDLRDNIGGNSGVANRFVQYLPVDSYRTFGATIRFSPATRAQRWSIRASGCVTLVPRLMPNRKFENLVFTGKVYVLTSPRTFSSGKWFAVLLKDNGLATLVGEPMGNAPSTYGDTLRFTLPHTGHTFFVSYKQFVSPSGDTTSRWVTPDFEVATTIEDILLNRDPQLDRVRSLIRAGGGP